jgi:3-phenylpropionate/trans-cinnamate dioxygenase ferredoxin reductase subunit
VNVDKVVIVGAGLAGARAAETLRARGFDGDVVMIGDEPVAPYERPALSKEYLAGSREPSRLLLRPRAFWESSGIDLRLGERVVRVDYGRRIAVTGRGDELAWDAIVLATGARPRRLPIALPRAVHVLRTLADATALRGALVPGARLVVVGGGFVGAEVASTAVSLGVDVTVVEAGAAPLARPLGKEVGRLLARRFRDDGVDLRTRAGVASVDAGVDGRRVTVVLTDGSRLTADAALVAVGVEPELGLLPGCPDGRVHPCGDVVGPGHWTSAARDGVAAAHRIMGLEPPPPQPHYVWSDQFGLRLQLVGEPSRTAAVELDGCDRSFTARYRDEHGRLVAALLANRPHEVAVLRRELPLAA